MKINRTKKYFRIIFSIMIFLIIITTISCNSISQTPAETDNKSPTILSEPDKTANVGVEYQYIIEAYDAEGDALFYSLNIAPQDMEIDSSTGIITWTPGLNQFGEHQVEIKVSDGNLFEAQSFKITVYQENETEEMTQLFFDPLSLDVLLGSEIEIDVKVENVVHLMAASITLNFNASKLEYSSSFSGSWWSGFIVGVTPGSESVTIDMMTIGEKPSGTGNIITVIFNSLATGATGITFGPTQLVDENGIDITHTQGSGCSINVE